MEQLPQQEPLHEESPLNVVFRAPLELVAGVPVTYEGKAYSIKDIYTETKDGVEKDMYLLEDSDGESLQKDGILVYVPAEDLEAQ